MRSPLVAKYIRCRFEASNRFYRRVHIPYYTLSSSIGQIIINIFLLKLVKKYALRYTKLMVKQPSKKTVKKQTNKVDFEPNKMALAVSAMAAASLVLVAVIATQS